MPTDNHKAILDECVSRLQANAGAGNDLADFATTDIRRRVVPSGEGLLEQGQERYIVVAPAGESITGRSTAIDVYRYGVFIAIGRTGSRDIDDTAGQDTELEWRQTVSTMFHQKPFSTIDLSEPATVEPGEVLIRSLWRDALVNGQYLLLRCPVEVIRP